MNLKLITNYWSQITVIIGAIGFIIKVVADWNTKKKEISFLNLQENKILEIKSFYKSYQKLMLSLSEYHNQTRFGDHSPLIFKRIKHRIYENFREFDYQRMVVKLFIDKSEIETVDEIYEVLKQIKIDIDNWHIYSKATYSLPDGWDKLDEIKDVRLSITLPKLINKVETNLRKNLNIN